MQKVAEIPASVVLMGSHEDGTPLAFTLLMTGIIATMCTLLTQIKATYRNDIRKIDAATTAAR